jgi:hypothetical protein
MADDIDRSEWGHSQTSKEVLNDFWGKLLEKADYCEKEEIKFFLHCTTLTGKKSIMKSGRLYGGQTGLPARAPLASYDDLKGIWLAISSKDLPRRSPYGTQRMVFRVRDIMTYLGTDLKEGSESDNEDKWDAPESDDDKGKGGKSNKRTTKKKNKGKHRTVNREQKECYLKHKIPTKPKLSVPLLFFECAHYYGSTQYARLLLVRSSDPKADWCREMCKELDIRDNPFLQFLNGRIWTYRSGDMGRDIVVEVLVVGDIVFDQLLEPPSWDEVGTVSRAGFDPRLGVC